MNRLAYVFGRIFDIRAGEWQRLLLLYLLSFSLNASVVWGQATAESLFLQRVGIDHLPLMFIADALLTALAIIIYGAFVDRISNTHLMIAIALIGSGILVCARIVLMYNIVLALLYLLERVLRAIITIHAWTYIADFYDTRIAKRHFPLIGSASRTSGILAGVMIPVLVQLFHAENLVLAWMVALLASGWLAWITPRIVPPEIQLKRGKSRTSVLVNMQEGFTFVTTSGFLRYLALAAVIGTILLYLLEYQSQQIIANSFESADDQASFYGLLGAVADLVTLPIQMFLLSRLVRWLGVGNANLIFPSLSAFSYALVSLLPSLLTAGFARVDRTALRSAFRTPIDGLLFNAVPLAIKGRARAFINGLLIPLGSLLAGILLLLVGQGLLAVEVLIGLGLLVAVGYVFVSLRVRAEYRQSITSLLAEDEMAIFRINQTSFEPPDPAAIDLLYRRLDESQNDATAICVAEMIYEAQGRAAFTRLRALAGERGAEVRAALIQMLGSDWIDDPGIRQMCMEALSDPDALVRQAAVATLARASNAPNTSQLVHAFRELLHDPDEKVQAGVIPTLLACHQPETAVTARQILSDWLSDRQDSQRRVLGLRVLAQTGDERLLPTLHQHINDPSPVVRREAIELIDRLIGQTPHEVVRQQSLSTLQNLLGDEDESVRLAVVETLGHLKTVEATKALLIAMDDPCLEVRKQACIMIDPLPIDELEAALEGPQRALAESAAFVLSRANHPRGRRRALEVMESLVYESYLLRLQCLALEAFDTLGVRLLRTSLKEQAGMLLDRAFWVLSALSGEREALAILHSLQSDSSLNRANAAEALESIALPRLALLITPLFDNSDPSALPETARTMLDLRVPSAWEVFSQTWPRLGERTVTNTHSLTSLHQSGWITAVTIYALFETDLTATHNGIPISQTQLLAALESTLNDPNPLIRETAQLMLRRSSAAELSEITERRAMMTMIEKVLLLKEVPFFQAMTINELRILSSISEEMTCNEGQQIFDEGEYGDALYVVVSGAVALQRQTKRGRRSSITRMATLGPGDYFAEMSIFDNEPHANDAVALRTTQLLLVRRAPLVALIRRQPDLCLSVLKVLSQRLRQANETIAEKSQSRPKELMDIFDKF